MTHLSTVLSSADKLRHIKFSKTKIMSCTRSGVPVLFFSLVAAVRYLARRVHRTFSPMCVCAIRSVAGATDRFSASSLPFFFGRSSATQRSCACSSSFSAHQTWVLPPVWHMAKHSMKQFNAYFFNACDVCNLVPCNTWATTGGASTRSAPSPPPTLRTPYPA